MGKVSKICQTEMDEGFPSLILSCQLGLEWTFSPSGPQWRKGQLVKAEPRNPSRATAGGLKIMPVPGWLACALSPCRSALEHLTGATRLLEQNWPIFCLLLVFHHPPWDSDRGGPRGVGLSPPFPQLQNHTSQRKLKRAAGLRLPFHGWGNWGLGRKSDPTTSGPESRSPASQAGTLCTPPRGRWPSRPSCLGDGIHLGVLNGWLLGGLQITYLPMGATSHPLPGLLPTSGYTLFPLVHTHRHTHKYDGSKYSWTSGEDDSLVVGLCVCMCMCLVYPAFPTRP